MNSKILPLLKGNKQMFKKILINFSICYFFMNINYRFTNGFSFSSKELRCAQGFWGKKSEGIELNNLSGRLIPIQYNANDPIEDRFSAVELKNFQGYFISVLDGHGGHQLAEFANQRLHKYFDQIYKDMKEGEKLNEDELVIKSLLKTFEKVEKEFYEVAIDLYRKGEGKLATVGSCVIVSVISPSKVYTAQLGDSKAKLFQKKDKGYSRVKLTTTHNSDKKSEQAILFKEFPDKDIVVCKRPNNTICYVKGRLQPTRSLGDFHLKYREFNEVFEGKYKKPISNFNGPYIKSVPEIKVHEITKDDEYIVMGTDGLWDFVNSKDVAEIVSANKTINNLANSLFFEVMNRASRDANMDIDRLMKVPEGHRRNLHDDITVLVFDLRH